MLLERGGAKKVRQVGHAAAPKGPINGEMGGGGGHTTVQDRLQGVSMTGSSAARALGPHIRDTRTSPQIAMTLASSSRRNRLSVRRPVDVCKIMPWRINMGTVSPVVSADIAGRLRVMCVGHQGVWLPRFEIAVDDASR